MGKTVSEVSYVYELAKDLMDKREKDYEGSWKQEGYKCMNASAFRKASSSKTRAENGRWKEDIIKTKEDILDEINYCVLQYRLIELEENNEAGA